MPTWSSQSDYLRVSFDLNRCTSGDTVVHRVNSLDAQGIRAYSLWRVASSQRKSSEPLFKPLPSGNRGISRERVAHHQRMRLMGAMLHACDQHGFAAVTVSELARLAAVSNRDFYEHFAGKEACFLETHDFIVEEGTARIAAAFRAHDDWRDGVLAGFEAYFALVREEPAAAHLVIVDALTAGPQARAHRRRAMSAFERMLREGLDQADRPSRVDDVTIGVIIAGTRRVVYRHLRDGTVDELGQAARPIMDLVLLLWEAADRRPLPRPRETAAPVGPVATLPAKAPARERILAAVGELAVADGYLGLSLPAIAKTARCSIQTFYKFFETKEAAFGEALSRAQDAALAAVGPAMVSDAPWPQRATEAITALLEDCAQHPADCELLLRSEIGGPPGTLDRADVAFAGFMALLAPTTSGPPDAAPELLIECLGGGLIHVLQERLALTGPAGLPAIADQLVYLIVVPVLGVEGLATLSFRRKA
jgi:AcrR family transcriptional regulator